MPQEQPVEMTNAETMTETVTETQPKPDTPEALKAELEAARKALKDANREAADRRKKLEAYEKAEQERKQAEMTELERLQVQLKEATDKLSRQELDNKKRAIALKVGLPEELARKLEGATDEELEADAKSLLALIPKAPKAPTIPVTNPGTVDKAKTVEERKREIFGGPREVFDILSLRPVEFPEGGSE